jgi:deoxyribodipyrimidine photo-lyase
MCHVEPEMFRTSFFQTRHFLHPRSMPKRTRSPVPDNSAHLQNVKRPRVEGSQFRPIKVATMEVASAVDANPPYFKLKQLMDHGMPDADKGEVVFYWMRFADLRSTSLVKIAVIRTHSPCLNQVADNRALHKASELARKADLPLAILFVLSPEDYLAHDRSSRRVDFVLRNLKLLRVCV